jgi:hypothetical protein
MYVPLGPDPALETAFCPLTSGLAIKCGRGNE